MSSGKSSPFSQSPGDAPALPPASALPCRPFPGPTRISAHASSAQTPPGIAAAAATGGAEGVAELWARVQGGQDPLSPLVLVSQDFFSLLPLGLRGHCVFSLWVLQSFPGTAALAW